MVFVLDGIIRVYKLSPEGKEITLYRLGKGETCVLSVSCIMGDLHYPAMAEVEEEFILGIIPAEFYKALFLAKEFGVTVFANDLWIKPTDNYHRFVEMGVDDKVFPICEEAHALPYAENYFDAAISIDAYHYFGTDEIYFPNEYSRLVKPGGQLGIVSPGLSREFSNGLPEGMKAYWEPDMYSFHSAKWWCKLWGKPV